MKNKILISFLFFFGITNAQSVENLRKGTTKMYDASYNMEFETILDLTYPKLFEMINRETMLTVLDQTFQNDLMRIRLVHPNTTFNYSEIKNLEGKKICVIRYPQAMRLIMEAKLDDESLKNMEEGLNTNMKNKKIKYEKDRNAFYIEGNEIMIGIADETTQNEWRFINYDPNQLEMLHIVLGKKIVEELGL